MTNDEHTDAITMTKVTKVLGGKPRTDDVTFTCPPGQVYGLLGPNGAGKSTLMKLIMGLYRPTTGTVRVFGLNPVADAQRVRRLIGVVPQDTALYPELNAIENLRFHAALYMKGRADARIRDVLDLVELSDRATEPVKNYSGGMKRRLAIGRALLPNPDLLLLDEPTLGVDVQATHRIWDYIARFKQEGRTVIVATNIMAEADALCDKILLLDRGALVRFDTPANLKAELGSSTIRITPAPGAVLDEVAVRRALGDVELVHGQLRVAAAGGDADLTAVLTRLAGVVDIAGVEVHHPTLADVFLTLTGRTLRD
ncbi:ABC transporter ATP-binding protein [Corynebacterium uterequi]|uniref:ABC-type multidrug transport system, ATPase component n=1 Tax=Corynebacterium uterequi TaxID=1072256 RepID=A0A0G3HJ39_9CORY|nr:ABC transporter ATP-binding protein [Corynebacterium uterequi]AKK11117.1 ABC-type multidrug transport system, ATPase component [Corynebacterium uterequi]